MFFALLSPPLCYTLTVSLAGFVPRLEGPMLARRPPHAAPAFHCPHSPLLTTCLARIAKQRSYKPFRITSFADPHPLTPLESHLFEKQGGEGGTKSRSLPRIVPHESLSSIFVVFITSLFHYFITSLATIKYIAANPASNTPLSSATDIP